MFPCILKKQGNCFSCDDDFKWYNIKYRCQICRKKICQTCSQKNKICILCKIVRDCVPHLQNQWKLCIENEQEKIKTKKKNQMKCINTSTIYRRPNETSQKIGLLWKEDIIYINDLCEQKRFQQHSMYWIKHERGWSPVHCPHSGVLLLKKEILWTDNILQVILEYAMKYQVKDTKSLLEKLHEAIQKNEIWCSPLRKLFTQGHVKGFW